MQSCGMNLFFWVADKDLQIAVLGIYAEKWWQNCWHDMHVKTGRFQNGNLVLLFTLKKHKWKLKMRVTSFINASALESMKSPWLRTMHATIKRKEGLEMLKTEAQHEARKRLEKAKLGCMKHRVSSIHREWQRVGKMCGTIPHWDSNSMWGNIHHGTCLWLTQVPTLASYYMKFGKL